MSAVAAAVRFANPSCQAVDCLSGIRDPRRCSTFSPLLYFPFDDTLHLTLSHFPAPEASSSLKCLGPNPIGAHVALIIDNLTQRASGLAHHVGL